MTVGFLGATPMGTIDDGPEGPGSGEITRICLVKDPACGTKSIDPNPCPYDEEIHGRNTNCRCCAACRHECARDT